MSTAQAAFARREIRTVLCPIDFSEFSRHALDEAIAVARWYSSRLVVIHVWSPVLVPMQGLPAPVDALEGDELARVQREVDAFVRASLPAGMTPEIVVDVGRPARQLLECAVRV